MRLPRENARNAKLKLAVQGPFRRLHFNSAKTGDMSVLGGWRLCPQREGTAVTRHMVQMPAGYNFSENTQNHL